MLECAYQALSAFNVYESIPVVGHSMGGLSALAFTIEQPEKTERLVLIGARAHGC